MNTSLVKSAPQGDFVEVSVLMKDWETKFQALVSRETADQVRHVPDAGHSAGIQEPAQPAGISGPDFGKRPLAALFGSQIKLSSHSASPSLREILSGGASILGAAGRPWPGSAQGRQAASRVMPKRATTERWVVLLLTLFHLGIGALIGVSVARHLHHSGERWFGPVIMGIFFGVLGTMFVLFLVSNLPREIAKVFYLRSNKTKVCGALRAWKVLGATMLFGHGGRCWDLPA